MDAVNARIKTLENRKEKLKSFIKTHTEDAVTHSNPSIAAKTHTPSASNTVNIQGHTIQNKGEQWIVRDGHGKKLSESAADDFLVQNSKTVIEKNLGQSLKDISISKTESKTIQWLQDKIRATNQ